MLQNQCATAGVPFFFKQWGAWAECKRFDAPAECVVLNDGQVLSPDEADPLLNAPIDRIRMARPTAMVRVGKHRAGALLDGRKVQEVPRWPTI